MQALENLTLAFFLAATIVQLAYWLGVFSRLALYRQPPPAQQPQEPISVIVCARNEAENLQKNLPSLLAQDYPDFEVIVVNDASTDKTLSVLLDFQRKNPKLRIVNLTTKINRGKKAALNKGIEAANFDLLFLTDADCRPASNQWLSFMQPFVKGRVKVGLGYSPYLRATGVLNAFIRFETVYSAIQYFSFAFAGLPYMGVGRNLAYRKSLFVQHGGFATHTEVTSGDDDLFVNEVADSRNTRVVLSPDTFVFSTPKSSWRGYYRQKTRHLSTGARYKLKHKLLLGLISGSHFGHYMSGIALAFFFELEMIVIINYLARMGVVSLMYYWILRKLRDPWLLPWVPLFDALYILYYLLFTPALFKTKEPWT